MPAPLVPARRRPAALRALAASPEHSARPTSPSRPQRYRVALLVGLLAALLTYGAQLRLDREGARSDLVAPLLAARMFVAGEDVYGTFGLGGRIPLGMNYPATALPVVAPLTVLPLHVAEATFMGLGFALLAYASTRRAWWPLFALLSWPAMLACRAAQWAPLLAAAALLPGLGWLLACKPTIGAAVAVQRLDRRWWIPAVVGGVMLLALTLARRPAWPAEWWGMLTHPRTGGPDARNALGLFLTPVGHPIGPVLLLALLRWRRPEARLLAALSCAPQVMMGYDALALLVAVPRTRLQALAFTVASWAFAFAYAAYALQPTIPATFQRGRVLLLVWLYLPALVLVLRRPNVGAVPTWLDRLCAGPLAQETNHTVPLAGSSSR